jgi:hypothetical protein
LGGILVDGDPRPPFPSIPVSPLEKLPEAFPVLENTKNNPISFKKLPETFPVTDDATLQLGNEALLSYPIVDEFGHIYPLVVRQDYSLLFASLPPSFHAQQFD